MRMVGLLGLVVGQVHAISMAGGCWTAWSLDPGDAAGEACARVRSEAPGEARSRESIIGCEGARGREANHACGRAGLMVMRMCVGLWRGRPGAREGRAKPPRHRFYLLIWVFGRRCPVQ